MTYRPTLDEVYLRMLDIFARRSTCVRRQVAAIFVDGHGRYLSSGYNGVPKGQVHCIDVPCEGAKDLPGNNNHCEAVHAEQNAILQCPDLDKVHTVYCSCTPCFSCAKMLCNLLNLKRIVVNETYTDKLGRLTIMRQGIQLDEPDQSISDATCFIGEE